MPEEGKEEQAVSSCGFFGSKEQFERARGGDLPGGSGVADCRQGLLLPGSEAVSLLDRGTSSAGVGLTLVIPWSLPEISEELQQLAGGPCCWWQLCNPNMLLAGRCQEMPLTGPSRH